MVNPLITWFVDVQSRTQREGVGLVFGSLIDKAATLAAERNGLIVILNKVSKEIKQGGFVHILSNFRAERFEEVPDVSQNWEVTLDGMFVLFEILQPYVPVGSNTTAHNVREPTVIEVKETSRREGRKSISCCSKHGWIPSFYPIGESVAL
jgi:hypothetical protein